MQSWNFCFVVFVVILSLYAFCFVVFVVILSLYAFCFVVFVVILSLYAFCFVVFVVILSLYAFCFVVFVVILSLYAFCFGYVCLRLKTQNKNYCHIEFLSTKYYQSYYRRVKMIMFYKANIIYDHYLFK